MRAVKVWRRISVEVQKQRAITKIMQIAGLQPVERHRLPQPSAAELNAVAEPLNKLLYEGLFHQWMQEADRDETWVVGVIEKYDGSIHTPLACDIEFIKEGT